MKIVQINSCYGVGSTGKIAEGISNILTENNIENYIFYGTGKNDSENAFRIGNDLYLKFNILKTRIFGKHGFYSHIATYNVIKKLDKIKPDIIHLHNIHGHYINIKMLFNYIKKNNIKTIWTLHDCWAFTGHCAHFDYIGCEKWKTVCDTCPQLKEYPKSLLLDRSRDSYSDKKQIFTEIGDLTVVTPSKWLGGLVKQSFLKNYPIKVINNGIDLNSFRPIRSNFHEKYNLENKFIVMGIASDLKGKKGGKYLIELAERLDENYAVVIVGLPKSESYPKNVIVLPRTNSKEELAKVYSASDVFANPTLEDTFPTVNLEALACGTPVVTFNTGGSPESVDEKTGFIVEKENIEELYQKVVEIKNVGKQYYKEYCLKKANDLYNEKKCFEEYLEFYKG